MEPMTRLLSVVTGRIRTSCSSISSNASAQVASGAAIIIDDADLDRKAIATSVIPLVVAGIMRDGMTASAAATAREPADDVLARMVLDATGRSS